MGDPHQDRCRRAAGAEGVAECAELARAGGLASVAIGGIGASSASLLAGVPVDGLCVVSAIAAAPDPGRPPPRCCGPPARP
ncbi:thiamine phosphate synthase [Rothia sp. AR01]|uniref:Thiamine phosphate synthase n=1 Tax=Rothia santali TaxID=2949643 RepID=A0A9X2HEN4_9MICC|nr:thiamine phosphate synthase [Rothia santali]